MPQGSDFKALLCERLGDPQETMGKPHSALRVARMPVSPLPNSSVRIKVAAAALNFADALQLQVGPPARLEGPTTSAAETGSCVCCSPCAASFLLLGVQETLSSRLLRAMFCDLQGQYQVKPKLPFVPGSECSGTVIEVGRDVRTVKVGDKV